MERCTICLNSGELEYRLVAHTCNVEITVRVCASEACLAMAMRRLERIAQHGVHVYAGALV